MRGTDALHRVALWFDVDVRAFLTSMTVCIERGSHSQVLCNTPVESCREYNRARAAGAYSDACFDDLIGRLEVPNDRVKWDKPLFEVEVCRGSFSI